MRAAQLSFFYDFHVFRSLSLVLALAQHHWRERTEMSFYSALSFVIFFVLRVVVIISSSSSSHYKRESVGMNELTRFHILPCILLLNDILLMDEGQKETNEMKLRKCFFLLIMANLIFNPIHLVWVVFFFFAPVIFIRFNCRIFLSLMDKKLFVQPFPGNIARILQFTRVSYRKLFLLKKTVAEYCANEICLCKVSAHDLIKHLKSIIENPSKIHVDFLFHK